MITSTFDRTMLRLFGASWRTSIRGFLSIFVTSIGVLPQVFGGVTDSRWFALCTFIVLVIQGSGLMVAKDAVVSGEFSKARSREAEYQGDNFDERERQ
jgi:hypothetical protein